MAQVIPGGFTSSSARRKFKGAELEVLGLGRLAPGVDIGISHDLSMKKQIISNYLVKYHQIIIS